MKLSSAAVLPAAAAALLLAGCTGEAPEPEAESTEVPEDLARQAPPPVQAAGGIGTPMADRVATIGLLNKRNNIAQDLEMTPGEARRVGDVVIRLAACERTAPWETRPETGAFVQVSVRQRPDADSDYQWQRIFSGWLFKNSPSLNVVEHPIYDVWVKDCAMSFPGEEATPRPARDPAPRSGNTPAAPATAPEAPAAPAPAPTPEESPLPAPPAPAEASNDA
jgi:hypothetical protein